MAATASVIADSVTVVAALLVVVIAATGAGTSLVAWAAPLGMAALGLARSPNGPGQA